MNSAIDSHPYWPQPRKNAKENRSLHRIILSLCAMLVGVAPTEFRGQTQPTDLSGTWSWTTPAPAAAPPDTAAGQPRNPPAAIRGLQRKTILTLKLDGDKLTGTIFTQLSQPRTNAVPITHAKLEGDTVSFTVVRELSGKQYVQKFSGKVSGDAIKGKVEFERDGQARSADWVAQRVVEGEQQASGGRTAASGRRGSGTNSPAFRISPKRPP